MTTADFLRELQEALHGEVEASVVQETVAYYTQYIQEEIRAGRSEEEILADLGPARLIAKSILEARAGKHENAGTQKENRTQKATTKSNASRKGFTFHSWYGRLLLILLAIVAVAIVLALIIGAVVAVWYLLPVVAVIVLIFFLVRFFLRRNQS